MPLSDGEVGVPTLEIVIHRGELESALTSSSAL